MMQQTFWQAPAKLNLFLHITAQREDGYHELQTLFQLLDFGDELGISLREDEALVRVHDVPGIAPEDDLVMRAAKQLQQYSPHRQGAEISLKKCIPIGGGLGGGSSDAATVLVALNHLWRLGLTTEKLADIGLGLGADVPVFVAGSSAWAEGIGESLEPMNLPERWFLLVYPGGGISTAEIFQHPELTRNSSPITISGSLDQGEALDELIRRTRNDCEGVVRRMAPEVDQALEWLSAFAPARMSGTGATVFAVFNSRAEADEVHSRLPDSWWGTVAKGINRSPLLETVAATA